MRLVERHLCCMLLACACGGALAQGYPNRPIRILVGFTPGGGPEDPGACFRSEIGKFGKIVRAIGLKIE
ncbi:MAG: hypothetical protein HY526_13715 [Betaproteobacteria bacterium]|nr:hypothetical protein [Betaproteobacteria bacterium]